MEKLHWVNQKNGFALNFEILPPILMLTRENCTIITNLRDGLSLIGQKSTKTKN